MTRLEIDELIRRFDEDKCTTEEVKMINNFLNSYQNEYKEWDNELIGDQKEIGDRIYSQITGKIAPRKKGHNVILRWWYRSAAALIIILSLFYFFNRVSKETPVEEKAEAWVVKNISWGQKSTLHLIDGTLINVNSDTKISYPKKFAGDKREIYLDGEAFFEVSHNPEKPFIVHAGTIDIKVLGTSFNINTFDNKITVTLASGKIHINNTNPDINYSDMGVLIPNQQFIYNKSDNSIQVSEVDVDPYIAWTKKQLIFREEPIFSVVKKLEKWYDVEFTYANNDIKNCIFTGIFENEPLRLVLESLHNVADISFTMKGRKVKLSGLGCPKRNSNVQSIN